jgi:hypothetical protein
VVDKTGSASACRPVYQLIASQQGNGDSRGIGDVLRTVDNQVHRSIRVGRGGGEGLLEFE